jgi:riboflavin synthase
MFTGIIAETTEIVGQKINQDGLELVFNKPKNWTDLELGESIATNGVCLTIAQITNDTYICNLIPETLSVSTFGTHIPKRVNLERAMRANDRLSGHFVQGHVDTVTTVTNITKNDEYRLSLKLAPQHKNLVVHKGSITIDGVSLTVATCDDGTFEVALVPHTLSHTTLGDLQKGDGVNIEFDVLGKYVANILEKQHATS